MSSFIDGLLESANSWSSAYLQFETGYRREGFLSYAFVEDDDDINFYQRMLSNIDGICYLGCGGKSGVITLFQRLTLEGKAAGQLFMVDRDTEREPFVDAQEILRTSGYSWESHACEADYVGWFLQRRLEPNLNPDETEQVKAFWLSTVDSFKSALDRHTALCRTASLLNVSLGMSRVSLHSQPSFDDLPVEAAQQDVGWYAAKVALAVSRGAAEIDIERRFAFYSERDPLDTARGKHLFLLLRAFVRTVMGKMERASRGEINSAKAWIDAMPWNRASTDYIREYAERRLAEA